MFIRLRAEWVVRAVHVTTPVRPRGARFAPITVDRVGRWWGRSTRVAVGQTCDDTAHGEQLVRKEWIYDRIVRDCRSSGYAGW